MRRTLNFLLLPALLISLFFIYGCPVDMDYPPDEPGSVPIDKNLVGTWNCVSDTCTDLKKVIVEKIDESSYNIQVVENGDNYMADDYDFTGYITTIDGKKFIYALGETSGTYYTYNYELKQNKLTLYDVGLIENGRDSITSTDAFRKEISASLKKEGCLSGRFDFVKE